MYMIYEYLKPFGDFFKDRFAHDIVAPQPGFQMQTNDWKGYSIFSIRNPFTSW